MGRRRKIFTQREYERLSKTHAGRQKINTTYAGLAIFVFLVSLGIVIGSYFSFYLAFFRTFAYIALFISPIVALVFICLYRSENEAEKERIKKNQEEQQERIRQQNAKIERDEYIARIKAEEEQERLRKFKNSDMDTIDKMNGYQFETFVSEILKDLGYNTVTTKKSGDFGVDIIVEKNNEKIIIQTKRYAKKVSLNAVQEISSAKSYYKIQTAWLITNNYFTEPAKQLAHANKIKLIDRNELANIIIEAKNTRENQKESA